MLSLVLPAAPLTASLMQESVLAAQTKDKKRINDLETEVYIAWQSCLYVTNFPESFDKAALEHLFAKYGTIFDTRWPSKRFKNTRRFCYVQFANPVRPMTRSSWPWMQDGSHTLTHRHTPKPPSSSTAPSSSPDMPSRSSSRTRRAKSRARTPVRTSVSCTLLRSPSRSRRSTCASSLSRLEQSSASGSRRMTRASAKALLSSSSRTRFALSSFPRATSVLIDNLLASQSAAQEALSLNNHELKKRHMSVTVAQARQAGTGKFSQPERRVETENRGVRVRGLANDTQEAVIQQEFEKIAPVRRVNYVAGSSEAVVLLENPAVRPFFSAVLLTGSPFLQDAPTDVRNGPPQDVGKVLMQRDAMLINGQQVTLLAEGRQTRPAAGGAKQGTGATGEGRPTPSP